MKARLALETGHVFHGHAFGSTGGGCGEVVFNTAMTGYQEVVSDPSYAGQIVVMTYPLIGNCGVNAGDSEFRRPHLRGLVVRELCTRHSSWRAGGDLAGYMERHGITGITGVDTRALTRIIRDRGTPRGVLSTGCEKDEHLLERAKSVTPLAAQDLLSEVSTPRTHFLPGTGPRVVVLDLGLKRGILRALTRAGCDVVVVPHAAGPDQIMGHRPGAVVLSSGPGDPQAAAAVAGVAASLVGTVPLLGICLGYQLLALALGASTFKMKFGHRGGNHPVRDLQTGRVDMTSQNHGYAVDEGSLGPDLIVTHRNVHDGTVEGFRHRHHPVMGIQFHPEASPGPLDTGYLFGRLMALVNGWPGKEAV